MATVKKSSQPRLFKKTQRRKSANPTQRKRVLAALRDAHATGGWIELDTLAIKTSAPPASVSAQLRHLRKKIFGGHRIEKRWARDHWEYRLAR